MTAQYTSNISPYGYTKSVARQRGFLTFQFGHKKTHPVREHRAGISIPFQE